MKIDKYSFGIGDRFGLQGLYQLKAIITANENGIPLVPVWNKSNREHNTIHTEPQEVRIEADIAVKTLGWKGSYFVDADHINLGNVQSFISSCDFFTIDVADFIGQKPGIEESDAFVQRFSSYTGKLMIPGIDREIKVSKDDLLRLADRYLFAIKKAGEIYRFIGNQKGFDGFITEVSMDEVDKPQTPTELFFILAGLASEGVPAQTIAPKFTGRFNKGVDYEGDITAFAKEFEEDIQVLNYAKSEFDLPDNLKLSVHSGSDKFSIYPVMGNLIRKHNCGIHVKTAGTTWLEEMIGLALAGGEALALAASIYNKAWQRKEELCRPYSTVISIDQSKLPSPEEVVSWNSEQFAGALRHIPGDPMYNPHFRQLIHVGYKIAAEYSNVYLSMVGRNAELVGKQVYENIYDRHIKRLFDL